MLIGNSYVLASALLGFYWALLKSAFTPYQPDVMTLGEAAANHAHYRRFTPRYRRKRNLVKTLWLAASIITLLNPVVQLALGIALFMTCISFSILDETQ